jgi:hypothetical protein
VTYIHHEGNVSVRDCYGTIFRKSKIKPNSECRCDERLKTKVEESSRLSDTRLISDEVFDESFCEFFIPTEDCATAAKLTGLGNTRKLFKMESFRGPQRV